MAEDGSGARRAGEDGGPEVSGALVKNTEAQAHLVKLLDAAKSRLAALVPPGVSVERVNAITLNMFSRDPSLRECTPESIVRGVTQIVEWGLDPSPKMGQAFLIARNVKVRGKGYQRRAEAQLGYKGVLAKAYRNPRILSVSAVVVHERDQFDIERGTHPAVFHKYKPSEDRGKPSGLYFASRLAPAEGDVWAVDEMTVDEVNAIRDRSDGYRAFKAGRIKSHPWDWAWSEMARKTMLVRGLKQCPIDDAFRAALEADPDDYRGVAAEERTSSRTDDLKSKLGVTPSDVIDAEIEDEEEDESDAGSGNG